MTDLAMTFAQAEKGSWHIWQLAGRLDRATAAQPFCLCSPQGIVREVLEISRLDMFLSICPSVDALEDGA